MPMDTVKLTVRLPREHVEFAKRFARAHGISVTELLDRYLDRLQAQASIQSGHQGDEVSASVRALTGILPKIDDPEGEYRAHLERKYR